MSFSIFMLLLILSVAVKQTWCRVGVVYSPFVREEDDVHTKSYTTADVEVMLKLVQEKGYYEIVTYGMGVGNPGMYRANETWRGFASIVHTAVAAAEINKNKPRNTRLTVYQGLWATDLNKEQQESEIEVGFEMAVLANNIYNGTVKGIVFPSLISLNELLNSEVETLETISNRSRNMGLQFGTRISDCNNFKNENPKRLQNSLKWMDFVICQALPNGDHFIKGPQIYFNSVTRMIADVKEAIQKISSPVIPVKIMLETGWPGGNNLGQPNTNVEDMLQLWTLLDKWSKQQLDQQIFMHEAFNNPWKRGQYYGEHYGLWKHTGVNDNSKSAYELKKDVKRPSGPSYELIFGVVFGSVLFIMLSAMILVVYRRVKRFKEENRLTEEEIRQFLDGLVTNKVVSEDGTQENAWMKIPYNREFELQKEKFSIDKTALLGSGAFGAVYKGRIDGLVNDVAFKMTRPDCPVSALRGLLSEIKILLYLGKHKNVVSICGAYTAELQNGTIYLATELCPNGSLEKFLRMNKSSSNYMAISEIRYVSPASLEPETITDLQLMQWALEIASAMEYISFKNVIHADLATRNVLLSLDLTAKVTDFGLSRRLYEYTEYVKKSQEPLPWRWLSPESLARLEFSAKSDVWSYGVTLWEIFSLGDIPYPGLSWDLNFVGQLECGLKLQRPPRCSEEIYEIMTKCWNFEPITRPDFRMLKDALHIFKIKLLQNAENSKLIDAE